MHRVLTSGGAATALDGAATIRRMMDAAAGSGLVVMAGGGVTADNVAEIARATGVTEVHGTGGERVHQCAASRAAA